MPLAALRRVAEGLYLFYIDTFSKEAEKMMSRILGVDMTLLYSLWFSISKTGGKKTIGRFYRFFILNLFLGGIIRTNQLTGVCGYLYRSCLLRRFLTLGYCSIPINGLGGELNDFNK